ncbi:MAG: BlaI/MecI/CopY family transcriptional regulator [Lachnospiraceae bacterium]|nr:BlaI/MecI/CopY family transcriptional regulator [Lachnospiraceae bacterium]
MTDYKLGAVESKFADIVWEHEPLSTGELVKLCGEELQWKRTTTYTVLKKLSEHGFFQMENKTVTALISKENYYSSQSERFVRETFDGSLPAFIAAFTKRKALSEEEIAEIRRMIDGEGKK